jgi:FkbM family methyltransferase
MMLNLRYGGIHRDLFIHGVREPWSTAIFKKELRRGDVVIDVGANIGYYVLIEASCVGREGKVYAIEPSLRNLKYLLSNILLNSVQDRVIVKWLAIGDRNGVCDIEEGEAPNLDRISLFPFQRREGCAKIFMKTLDSFIEEEKIRKVDFIRMDVEGFEYRIIKGMKATLQRFSPKLFIEIHPKKMQKYYGDRFEDFLRELSRHGYIVKYAVWEPLTPIHFAHSKMLNEWKIVKGLKPEDVLRNSSLCEDWVRLFLEKE